MIDAIRKGEPVKLLRAGRIADEVEGEPPVLGHSHVRNTGPFGFGKQPQRLDGAARSDVGLCQAELAARIAGREFVGASEEAGRRVDIAQFERRLTRIEQGLNIRRISRQPGQRFAQITLALRGQGLHDLALGRYTFPVRGKSQQREDSSMARFRDHVPFLAARALTRADAAVTTGCSDVRGTAGC